MKAVAIDIPHGVALVVLFTVCIVAADRNAGVAALAQRHEISRVVGAPVCKRKDVMHFLSRRQPAFALTLLAQRMRLNITRTNFPPCSAVTLVGVGISLVFVVMALSEPLMFVAVPTVSQPAATRIGAGALGFSWHLCASLSGIRKATVGFLPRWLASILSTLPLYQIHI